MITHETIIFTILLVILTFVIGRKYFLLPYLIAACFIPADQRIIVMGLDFTPLRLLIVAGVGRLFLRRELRSIRLNTFDKTLAAWALSGATIYVIQWLNMGAVIYRCGRLFDIFGMYWVFRQGIRSWSDVHFIFAVLALCALVMTPFVAFEWTTGSNPFVFLGKAQTAIRGGSHRCQASFPHSIIMGLFWATLVPVFVGLSKQKRWKHLCWAATVASVLMVFSTNSSTPITTLIIIVAVLAIFRYRAYGRQIAYAICGSVVGLHLVMQAPVWHLISRIQVVPGSTGYHRYRLIDAAIRHFHEWALLGTRSTVHWGPWLYDITNWYIRQGIDGGFITLLLFVILLVMAVRIPGRYSLQNIPHDQQWLAWCICGSVIGHCVSFLGVSYFGQVRMLLYLTFAVVGMMSDKQKTLKTTIVTQLHPNQT